MSIVVVEVYVEYLKLYVCIHLEIMIIHDIHSFRYRNLINEWTHTIVLCINEQPTRIGGHSRDVPGRPEGGLGTVGGQLAHSPTAALSSSLEFGVNAVATYCRGHAVEIKVKVTVRVRARGLF